ncbi:MAG TPA: hypothetical protein PK781_02040 [Terrimesophilobacter sp.]|nr:hypothetical protein [Terrimesophilobacter sp.]
MPFFSVTGSPTGIGAAEATDSALAAAGGATGDDTTGADGAAGAENEIGVDGGGAVTPPDDGTGLGPTGGGGAESYGFAAGAVDLGAPATVGGGGGDPGGGIAGSPPSAGIDAACEPAPARRDEPPEGALRVPDACDHKSSRGATTGISCTGFLESSTAISHSLAHTKAPMP